MDAISMLRVSVALLAIAALGGVVMAAIRFTRKVNPPAWLALLHGLLAGAALTLILYAACVVGIPMAGTIALVLFLIAALGGLVMNLGYQQRQRLVPNAFVVVHAVIAVAGFCLLLLAAFGR